MKINFEVIPHNQMRYETCGDWWLDAEGVIQFRVSRMSNNRFSALVFIHEFVELMIELAKRSFGQLEAREILKQLVARTDHFDKEYEKGRPADDDESEPGCEPRCPVYQGHMAASAIEHIAAMILGVNYNQYADEIAAMSREK